MTETVSNIVSLKTSNRSLKQRVERKREVLQSWLDKGVPHDKVDAVPSSLTEAREWEDPSLDVHAIGSPNNFTTKHAQVGRDVQAIGNLITKLQAKIKRPKPKRRSADERPTITAKDVQEVIATLASQWHMAREEARRQRLRADDAEAARDLAREELRLSLAEVAELKRQLSGGLKLIR